MAFFSGLAYNIVPRLYSSSRRYSLAESIWPTRRNPLRTIYSGAVCSNRGQASPDKHREGINAIRLRHLWMASPGIDILLPFSLPFHDAIGDREVQIYTFLTDRHLTGE